MQTVAENELLIQIICGSRRRRHLPRPHRAQSRPADAGSRGRQPLDEGSAATASKLGIPVGLSSDVATTASADQFTQMHAIFASERARRHQAAWDEDLVGNTTTPDLVDSRQVLRWATIEGAMVAGVDDRTGSITPGKKADIVIIDGSAVNVAPIIDPVGAVVCAADISNVKTVVVDGRVVKEDFKLKADLAGPRKAVEASRDYLVSKFGVPEPGWLVKEGVG